MSTIHFTASSVSAPGLPHLFVTVHCRYAPVPRPVHNHPRDERDHSGCRASQGPSAHRRCRGHCDRGASVQWHPPETRGGGLLLGASVSVDGALHLASLSPTAASDLEICTHLKSRRRPEGGRVGRMAGVRPNLIGSRPCPGHPQEGLDSSGRPVEGGGVRGMRLAEPRLATAETDGKGRFVLEGVRLGPSRIPAYRFAEPALG